MLFFARDHNQAVTSFAQLPNHSTGKNTPRINKISEATNGAERSCRVGWPGLANNLAIIECATHNAGVSCRILTISN